MEQSNTLALAKIKQDRKQYLAEPETPSAFAPLQPTDSLPARISRIWSRTYRGLTVIEYPQRHEWAGQFVRYVNEYRTFIRADAAVELRRLRSLGADIVRTLDGGYAVDPNGVDVPVPAAEVCDE